MTSSLMVVNGVAYFASDKLYALDASTGQQKWAIPTDGFPIGSSPTVVNAVVYVASVNGKVYALDTKTGQQVWVFPIDNTGVFSMTVVDGVVYVGSSIYRPNASDSGMVY